MKGRGRIAQSREQEREGGERRETPEGVSLKLEVVSEADKIKALAALR